MTNRHSGYLIVLDTDVREDDAEQILNALRMVKGVLSVQPVVADPSAAIRETRVRRELLDKLYKVLEVD